VTGAIIVAFSESYKAMETTMRQSKQLAEETILSAIDTQTFSAFV
jgi:hypothetical protein